ILLVARGVDVVLAEFGGNATPRKASDARGTSDMPPSLLQRPSQKALLVLDRQLFQLLGKGPRQVDGEYRLSCYGSPDLARQVVLSDDPLPGRHHCPLDGILQLADVAGPGVGDDRLHRLWGELRHGVTWSHVLLREVSREQRDVVLPVA